MSLITVTLHYKNREFKNHLSDNEESLGEDASKQGRIDDADAEVKDRTSEEKRISMCILDDVAEHCGNAAFKMRALILEFFQWKASSCLYEPFTLNRAEKASIQMEALQYQRMTKGQAEYKQDAIHILQDVVAKRDEHIRVIKSELKSYREKNADIRKVGSDQVEADADEYYQEWKSQSSSSFDLLERPLGNDFDEFGNPMERDFDKSGESYSRISVEIKRETYEEPLLDFEFDKHQLYSMLKNLENHIESSTLEDEWDDDDTNTMSKTNPIHVSNCAIKPLHFVPNSPAATLNSVQNSLAATLNLVPSSPAAALNSVPNSPAVALNSFYIEIDKFGKTMSPSSEKSFASLLITLNDYISKLEASISAICVGYLSFVKLRNYRDQWTDVNTWDDQWSDYNTENSLSVMDTNLNKLDEYISTMMWYFNQRQKGEEISIDQPKRKEQDDHDPFSYDNIKSVQAWVTEREIHVYNVGRSDWMTVEPSLRPQGDDIEGLGKESPNRLKEAKDPSIRGNFAYESIMLLLEKKERIHLIMKPRDMQIH
ncbi:probable myosin-binding protein 5 isoform X1 [Tanacetum coccineum]|uniref:Probable myosin-binding protein 5 isoform X1 n=1 Tax=Tanacetum coccineum TaxID=301880 RepID=A0ABQ4XND7_9ASTR